MPSSVPGLAAITLSERAWSRLQSDNNMGSYFNFRYWSANTMDRRSVPPSTQPTTLFSVLNVALKETEEFGTENWWELHRSVADKLMDDVRAAGFQLLLDGAPAAGRREAYSNTEIAVEYPDHIDDVKYRNLLFEQCGLFVIGNVGDFAGKSFRVGLMSPPQIHAVNLYGALEALRDAAQSSQTWK